MMNSPPFDCLHHMKTALLFILLLMFAIAGSAQDKTPPASAPAASTVKATRATELANAALAAHGGDKLKRLRSLVMRGSVDVNVSGQVMPATFTIVISGERYVLEINNPFTPLKQVYDGRLTYSSMRGFSLPPITSLGFPLLP